MPGASENSAEVSLVERRELTTGRAAGRQCRRDDRREGKEDGRTSDEDRRNVDLHAKEALRSANGLDRQQATLSLSTKRLKTYRDGVVESRDLPHHQPLAVEGRRPREGEAEEGQIEPLESSSGRKETTAARG